jgi:protein O-GlcNAc transferase
VRLDRAALAYVAAPHMPAVAPTPALANGFVTFGYFGRSVRLNEGVIAAWSAILKAVPTSRLTLNYASFGDPATAALFADRFAHYGVERERLNLIFTSPQTTTWAAYGAVDIALDPFPHNAGTTTIEALWMGVPVLTLADRPSVGRMGAMILEPLGLGDWVAEDVAAYVAKAVAAASDLEALAALRAGMRERFTASALGDVVGLTRSMERAYRGAWRRWCGADTGYDRPAETP